MQQNQIYRTRITLEAIKPDIEKNVASVVKIENTKTHEIRNADSKSTLKKDERFVFYMQFYC